MIWFVSRHAEARAWALKTRLRWDAEVTHADPLAVSAGDRVFGTLLCTLPAAACAAGAEYWHLEVPLADAQRGAELSADELDAAGARLVRYEVRRVAP